MPASTLISLKRPAPDQAASRMLQNKQRVFGFWKGKRSGPLFDQYSQAIEAAETLAERKTAIEADPNLTDAGKITALYTDALPLLKSRQKFQATVTKKRDSLNKKVIDIQAETLAGYSIESNLHSRLIKAYSEMPGKMRAKLFANPAFAQQNSELAKAILAEPEIVTGLDSDQRRSLQNALLTKEQQTQLDDIDNERDKLRNVERALDTARKVVVDLTGGTESELNAIEATIEPDDDEPDENLSLAKGGVLKLNEVN